MLNELSIENFALIGELQVEFGTGFTVLTGETGAGKSIIIDALNAVLGERVGAEVIRGGEETASIEAVFDARDAPRALDALQQAGLRDGDDTTIILTRRIASGRSRYRVNRRASTLAVLKEIGQHLVDIHGQHEHQTLIHEESHLSFLDAFGGTQHLQLVEDYRQQFEGFQGARRALQDAQMNERERAQRMDMLQFQIDEIEAAGLEPDEEDNLRDERKRLQNAEQIREGLAVSCELIDSQTESGMSALEAVRRAHEEIEDLGELIPELDEIAQELQGAAVSLEESARSLRDHLETVSADPQRLEQIEHRLADIAALKRKYGDTIPQILDFLADAREQLQQLEDIESQRQQLEGELADRRKEAGATAGELSEARVQLADDLQQAVQKELAGLGMREPSFDVHLSREHSEEGLPASDGATYKATGRGIDNVRFMFSANTGEPVRRLSQIASGGELSRLMLALKSVCARGAAVPTVVLDEIDVGIGGRVAHVVGDKIASVSRSGQVLCVTHLPQIARLADGHIRVTKKVAEGRTVVRARHLDKDERIDEIARMLGGADTDATVRDHARQLLQDAEDQREEARQSTSVS